MAQNLIHQTISLITQNNALRLSEIPDFLLEAWIVGITQKSDYNFERDFIINIFNEIYEGQKELRNIDAAHEDSDHEECRAKFEQQLRAEKQRRESGEKVTTEEIIIARKT